MTKTFPIPRDEQRRLLTNHRSLIEAIAPGVRMFGSYARGEVTTRSDIDLLIPIGSNIDGDALHALQSAMFLSAEDDGAIDAVMERDLFWLLSRRIRAEARTLDEIIAGNYAPSFERDLRIQAALIAYQLQKIQLPIPSASDRGTILWCESALYLLQRVDLRVQKIPENGRGILPNSVWAGLAELRKIDGLYVTEDVGCVLTEEGELAPANPTKWFTTDTSRAALEGYATLATALVDQIRNALPDITQIEADIAGEGNPFPAPEIPEDWKWWRT
jgi:predicted nucleotidyltransferase